MSRGMCTLRTSLLIVLMAVLSAVGIFHSVWRNIGEISVDEIQSTSEFPSSPHQMSSITTISTKRAVMDGKQSNNYKDVSAQYLPTLSDSISQMPEFAEWQRHTTTAVRKKASTGNITEQRDKQQLSEREGSDISTKGVQIPQMINSSQSRGFVLALDYWEQQTSASRNLQSLQCWAAQYNLSVVEPAIVRSLLRTSLNDHPVSKGFWFRDLFDLAVWNKISSKSLHSELVTWDYFLSSAPRSVILVSFKYEFPDRNKQTAPPLPLERIKQGCTTKWKSFKKFFIRNHFHVVREVCFNFAYEDRLSNDQFKSYLYGHLSPASSTVVFSQWRGFGASHRVLIHDTKCRNTHIDIKEELKPSQRVLLTSARYQQLFLGGRPYIAIMARMEKVQSYLKTEKGLPTLRQCFSKLLSAWRDIKHQSGINATLLAVDMGRYGSSTAHGGIKMNNEFKEFFRSLYGRKLSLDHWEKSFQDVANTKDSGYVALLQKVLVVQAKCVVFIGGGSFQKHAETLYLQAHPTEQCVKIIHECTP